MADTHLLITENIDVWTSAIKKRSATGRGSNKKIELTGIKKLRELILELAVRGKLVPQDPNDEPASVLLDKIAAEKEQLIKDKKIKQTKALPEIGGEIPFELPESWEWARFPDVSYYSPGKTPSTKNSTFWDETNSGIPWVSIVDMEHYKILNITKKKVSQEASETVFKGHLVKAGTMLMSFKLTVGKISILGIDAYHNEAIISVTPFNGMLQNYIYRFLPNRAQAGNTKKAIMGNTLNSESLALILFPVPPLEEQHRIVAKVNELMLLCDQLEQQTEDSITAHQTLVETLLATLSNSENPAALTAKEGGNEGNAGAISFESNWARIAEHFDTLFTTEHSIDQLKQTILQLAVMGKLVPQNPNDEPASVLLEKIAAEKELLIKDKKIKKQKPLPAITEDEKPFELPNGWGLCRLAELIPQFQNGASSRGDSNGKEIVVFRLADIKDWQISMSNTRSLSINEKSIERYLLQQSDVLIIRVNGSADIVGRFITCHENYSAIYCDHFIRMRFPIECFSAAYLSLLGSSALIRERINDLFISTAGQKTVNQTHIGSLCVTLPPLAEQYRIVKKVDELMTLCQQLKSRLSDAQTAQLQLANTIVEQSLS